MSTWYARFGVCYCTIYGEQQDCADHDCSLQFWTDESARKFIADESVYPTTEPLYQTLLADTTTTRYDWFLEIWDNYPFGIERADAIRYFVLYHFGGIYIDLDDVRPSSSLPLSSPSRPH